MGTEQTLTKALAEVKKILRDFDLGGSITLVDKKQAVQLLHIEPSWSCAKLVDNGIKINSPTGLSPKHCADILESTVYLLLTIDQRACEARHFSSLVSQHLEKLVQTQEVIYKL